MAEDIIDRLAGVDPESRVGLLRREKPDLVAYAQGSYDALLEPVDPNGLSLIERHAVALRVGVLTGFPTVVDWHSDRLRQIGADEALIDAVTVYPEERFIDSRLCALLRHTDRVTRAPGEAEPKHIQGLKAAGLSPTEIVTLGQLIGFLAYQVRAIAVARAFAEERS